MHTPGRRSEPSYGALQRALLSATDGAYMGTVCRSRPIASLNAAENPHVYPFPLPERHRAARARDHVCRRAPPHGVDTSGPCRCRHSQVKDGRCRRHVSATHDRFNNRPPSPTGFHASCYAEYRINLCRLPEWSDDLRSPKRRCPLKRLRWALR